jgi:hypothetical protein
MKKILCALSLSVLFSLSALADGGMEAGGKTCTTNCFANSGSQIEPEKESQNAKSITETVDDYFNNMTKYLIEIAF